MKAIGTFRNRLFSTFISIFWIVLTLHLFFPILSGAEEIPTPCSDEPTQDSIQFIDNPAQFNQKCREITTKRDVQMRKPLGTFKLF